MVNEQPSRARASAGGAPQHERKTRRRWLWLALVAALVVGTYEAHAWWVSPEHRIAQFLAAARRGDAAGMLSLASPEEVERMRLSPATLQAALTDASGVPGGPVPTGTSPAPYGPPQINYNRGVSVDLQSRNGSPLTSEYGGGVDAVVIAYKTDSGWKIGISNYIRSMLASRGGMRPRAGFYAAFCARHGMPAEFYAPESGKWLQAPPPR